MYIYFKINVVKLKKKEKEKRRFIILQELAKKKSIFQISKGIWCSSATVARLKKLYENYLLNINYNKAINKVRLNREDDTWGNGKNEETPKEHFNGFPLNEKKRKKKLQFLISLDNTYI